VYETFNMSALWKLPIIFVIENNQYGMGTSVSRAAAGQDFADRGKSYGIPGLQVDGMDVLEVKKAGERAVEHAISGKGPYILEMTTYRYRGHSMSDPAKYRTKDEVNKMRQERDPIDNVKEKLLLTGLEEKSLKDIDTSIRQIVSEAVEFAQTSPEPDAQELYTDVLVNS